ncbi:MAG: hypothetical protein ACK40Q_08980 [Pseudothermotoga sp.]
MALNYGLRMSEVPEQLNQLQCDTIQNKLERLGQAVAEAKMSLEGIDEKLFGFNQTNGKNIQEAPNDIVGMIALITELAEEARDIAYRVREKL